MKKLISLALILLLTLSLAACGKPATSETGSTDTPPTEATDSAVSTDSQPASVTTEEEEPEEPPVEYETLTIQIHETTIPVSVSSRIRTKTLSDEWTEGLIEKLLQAPETGVTVEKFSDQEIPQRHFEDFAEKIDILVSKGSVTWFIARDVMFRYVRKGTDKLLCKVETHLGEGKEIELSEELIKMLKMAIEYAPMTRYRAALENGTLEQEYLFEGKHEIEVFIEEIVEIPATDKKSSPKYNVKLSLLSKKDKTVHLDLGPVMSGDSVIMVETKTAELSLKANQKQVQEFVIEGFPSGMLVIPAVIQITVDKETDCYVNIAIYP